MNILILANHFNPGGISSYILNLSRGLSLRGHKVYVASSGGQWLERLKRYNIEHIYLPLRTKSILSPKLIFAYFYLKKIVRDKQIQVIHAQTRVTSFLSSWISGKTSIPYLTTAHGFFRAGFGRRKFPSWGKMVIAISEAVQEHLIRDFGLSSQRTALVHNGIEISRQPYSQSAAVTKEIKNSLGLGEGPVVGILARLSQVKGHKYLLTAMRAVINEIPSAELLSVGDGSLKKGLEAQAARLGIEKKVHFVAAYPDSREAISIMDVFVMPSLQEGLGLAIMEAQAGGIPVVATAVGGIVSLVKDNQTGILVKPCDPEGLSIAIIDLLKDKEKAGILASRAREMIVNEFTLEKMAQGTEEVYQRCLNR